MESLGEALPKEQARVRELILWRYIDDRSMEQVAVQKMISDAVDETAATVLKEYLPKIADLTAQVNYWKADSKKTEQVKLLDTIARDTFLSIFSYALGYGTRAYFTK